MLALCNRLDIVILAHTVAERVDTGDDIEVSGYCMLRSIVDCKGLGWKQHMLHTKAYMLAGLLHKCTIVSEFGH
jgi:hypothetical protein